MPLLTILKPNCILALCFLIFTVIYILREHMIREHMIRDKCATIDEYKNSIEQAATEVESINKALDSMIEKKMEFSKTLQRTPISSTNDVVGVPNDKRMPSCGTKVIFEKACPKCGAPLPRNSCHEIQCEFCDSVIVLQ